MTDSTPNLDSHPRLAPGVRLGQNNNQQVLLMPERALRLNGPSLEIVRTLCAGRIMWGRSTAALHVRTIPTSTTIRFVRKSMTDSTPNLDSHPRLAPGVRLGQNNNQQVLLMPERALRLNGPSLEIVRT